MPELDDTDTLTLLETGVREAGRIARDYYGGSFRRWDKSKGNPVTEADIAIDKFLMDTLRPARPDYGWLSEETEDDPVRLKARSLFVVDPIDGTVAFMKGKPHFTICAGVVRDGRPVAGAVYNPITEECFTARKGGGAHLNGVPVHVSDRMAIEDCRMLGDRNMFVHSAWNNPPNRPWPTMHIESRGSVAYRMVLVACGQFDATIALSSKRDWDLAAAEIIVQEGGGKVTTHTGAALNYNLETTLVPSLVAAGPRLHGELLARVAHLTLPHREERR